jgi:hypothetical protein
MLYKTLSAAVPGIDANIIEVEVDVSGIKMTEDRAREVFRKMQPKGCILQCFRLICNQEVAL